MQIQKANELTFDPRPQMGQIFAEGFYDHGLKFFSKEKEKLAKATEHIFMLESFYIAFEGNEVAAFIGCTSKKPPPIMLNKKILRRELGFFRGIIAHWGLSRYMKNHKYPFEIDAQTGSIEFVATAPKHRGKGIAKMLLSHVMETEPYKDYVLEVVDTNVPAVRLYENLGFKEFKRTPSPSPKHAGFNYFVYMKRSGEGKHP